MKKFFYGTPFFPIPPQSLVTEEIVGRIIFFWTSPFDTFLSKIGD